MKYWFLTLSVLFNLLSYILYKLIANRTNDYIWYSVFVLGLILGAINIFFFTKALKSLGLSVAYPIFSAACISLMMMISYLFFHEKISFINVIGVILIIAGIIFVTH